MATVSLCTTPFVAFAGRQARLFGCPDLPIVHIPARLADRTRDEIAALARGGVDTVIAALTST